MKLTGPITITKTKKLGALIARTPLQPADIRLLRLSLCQLFDDDNHYLPSTSDTFPRHDGMNVENLGELSNWQIDFWSWFHSLDLTERSRLSGEDILVPEGQLS